MDDIPPLKSPGGAASRRKCLLGVTITLVEDSLSASEALRLMAVASGSRLRRADRLLTAERHLSLYRPNVVIVDLGLPDGSGLDLIRKMSDTDRARPGLIALSGGDIDEWGQMARAAGADALLPKPIGSIAIFQAAVLSVLPDRDQRPAEMTAIGSTGAILTKKVKSDDLSHALTLLEKAEAEGDLEALIYASQFITSLAVMLEDAGLQLDARVLMDATSFDGSVTDALNHLRGQLRERIGHLASAATG
ncbi:MAG: response regulator [Pseudomonadota bacterium]